MRVYIHSFYSPHNGVPEPAISSAYETPENGKVFLRRLLKNGFQNWAQCRNLRDPIDGGEEDGIMAAPMEGNTYVTFTL